MSRFLNPIQYLSMVIFSYFCIYIYSYKGLDPYSGKHSLDPDPLPVLAKSLDPGLDNLDPDE